MRYIRPKRPKTQQSYYTWKARVAAQQTVKGYSEWLRDMGLEQYLEIHHLVLRTGTQAPIYKIEGLRGHWGRPDVGLVLDGEYAPQVHVSGGEFEQVLKATYKLIEDNFLIEQRMPKGF